jgi:hypothetical protein
VGGPLLDSGLEAHPVKEDIIPELKRLIRARDVKSLEDLQMVTTLMACQPCVPEHGAISSESCILERAACASLPPMEA